MHAQEHVLALQMRGKYIGGGGGRGSLAALARAERQALALFVPQVCDCVNIVPGRVSLGQSAVHQLFP
jgi:hypothetical protein